MKNYTRRQSLLIATGLLTVPLLASAANAAGHSKKHTVNIKGFKFTPSSLTIKAGDTVEFVNQDGAPHTATADNGSFDTGRLRKGKSKTVSFDAKGSLEYFCAVHPMMRGKIIVE